MGHPSGVVHRESALNNFLYQYTANIFPGELEISTYMILIQMKHFHLAPIDSGLINKSFQRGKLASTRGKDYARTAIFID